MKTQSSFQDHLKRSKDTVSKWPSWKREVMGVVNKDQVSGTPLRCETNDSVTCGAREFKE